MGHRFAELAFTDTVKAVQEREGSREGYRKFEGGEAHHDRLGPAEAAFLAARDSFYMATVSETGWPYIQHRGGPPGFVKLLDEQTIELCGLSRQSPVCEPRQSCRRRSGGPDPGRLPTPPPAQDPGTRAADRRAEDAATLERLGLPGYRAKVERGLLIAVEAFDWNCPQHLTPRFTAEEIAEAVAPLHARIAELEAALARARDEQRVGDAAVASE